MSPFQRDHIKPSTNLSFQFNWRKHLTHINTTHELCWQTLKTTSCKRLHIRKTGRFSINLKCDENGKKRSGGQKWRLPFMLKVDDFRLIKYSLAFWEKIHTHADIPSHLMATLVCHENNEGTFILMMTIIIPIIPIIIITSDVIIWQPVLVEMRSIGLSAVSAYSQMPSPSHHHIVITISVYCHGHDGPHDYQYKPLCSIRIFLDIPCWVVWCGGSLLECSMWCDHDNDLRLNHDNGLGTRFAVTVYKKCSKCWNLFQSFLWG